MATVEAPRSSSFIAERVPRSKHARRARKRRITLGTVEVFGVFAVSLVAYLILGWRVVHDQHLIIFDATARLAHAYFVLWNDPPKLAAIGFVWAPLSTMVFLPFVIVKGLATSAFALTTTSAVFAALMMTILVRACAFLGMPWWQRLTLVLAFAVNPMILFYAVNGMSEAPFLCLLSAAVYCFIRWHVTQQAQWLVLCGVASTFAFLCRYELFAYAVVMGIAVPAMLMSRRRHQDEVEGSMVAYLAPVLYGLGLWIFFNWLILGKPLIWLQSQIGIGGGGDTSVSQTASEQMASTATTAADTGYTRVQLLAKMLHLNAEMFPLVLVMAVALVLAWTIKVRGRREPMTFWMGVLVAVNVLSTALLLAKQADTNLLQMRYNMRSFPVAVLGVAWLWYVMPNKGARMLVWLGGVALLVATIPLTWHTMNSWQYQYEENVFTRALSTGKDQEGTDAGGPYTIGNADDREMANWIKGHVPAVKDSILTDDGQTFGVMLADGRPGLYADRIDHGDKRWKRTLNKPWGKVHYLLAARYPLPPAGIVDEVQKRYPGVRSESLPGVSVEHANPHYVLLRVAARKPAARPSRFDKAVDADKDTATPRL